MKDWDVEIYSKNSSMQYHGSLSFFNEKIENFKERDLEVLDIGCGDGKITKEISLILSKSKVIGIDNSPSMLQHAKNNYSDGEILSFEKIDASELNFDKNFDLVVSSFCLHWVDNKKKLFEGIYKALKAEDSMVLLVIPFIYPHYMSIMDIMVKEPKWQQYFNNYVHPHRKFADSNYLQYAIDSGLKVIKSEAFPEKFSFKSKKEFCDFLISIMPDFWHHDDDTKESFISELADRYQDYEKSDTWFYRYYNYRLTAMKGSNVPSYMDQFVLQELK